MRRKLNSSSIQILDYFKDFGNYFCSAIRVCIVANIPGNIIQHQIICGTVSSRPCPSISSAVKFWLSHDLSCCLIPVGNLHYTAELPAIAPTQTLAAPPMNFISSMFGSIRRVLISESVSLTLFRLGKMWCMQERSSLSIFLDAFWLGPAEANRGLMVTWFISTA